MQLPSAYARFSRRLRALLVDAIIFVFAFYIGALVIDTTANSDSARRALWLSLVVAIVLYEPILVAVLGGTIGHRLNNLRVADDHRDGNVGFVKVVARAAIKALLGSYSFLTMALTRKNQAVHDIVTRTTVQIRDRTIASPAHFIEERVVDIGAREPSRLRRVLVILVYAALLYVGISLTSLTFMSKRCANGGDCSDLELTLSLIVLAVWIVVTIVIAIYGWKGRLLGCRPFITSNNAK